MDMPTDTDFDTAILAGFEASLLAYPFGRNQGRLYDSCGQRPISLAIDRMAMHRRH